MKNVYILDYVDLSIGYSNKLYFSSLNKTIEFLAEQGDKYGAYVDSDLIKTCFNANRREYKYDFEHQTRLGHKYSIAKEVMNILD